MAGLKRSHVAASLSHIIKNNGGCLAIRKTKKHDGVEWVRCSLHALSAKLKRGVALGEWRSSNLLHLRRKLCDCLQLLGVLPLKDELIVTVDSSVLADPEATYSSAVSKASAQTSGPTKIPDASASRPAPATPDRQDLAMTDIVPCGVGLIQDAINRILGHPRLCARYGRAVRANISLLRGVEAVASAQLVTTLEETLKLRRGSPSLSHVKFTLQWKKEIEEVLSRSPERFLHQFSTPEKSSSLSFNNEKHETSGDCAFFDSSFKNGRNENSAVNGSSPPHIPGMITAVVKKHEGNSSEILVDDRVLGQVADYFEPFDAALSDFSNSNDDGPNLGKLLPWIKTLRQYAADSVESVSKDQTDSGFRDSDRETPCEYCRRDFKLDGLKNGSSESNEEIVLKETNLGDINGLANDNYIQRTCLSLHGVGQEIVTNYLVPHPVHYVATFLTPHFKSLAMLDETERHKTLKWVKQLATDDRGIGTQFWMGSSGGSFNSSGCQNDVPRDDPNIKLSSTPNTDGSNAQPLNDNFKVNYTEPSDPLDQKYNERNNPNIESSDKNLNFVSKNGKSVECRKNPTLKSLLEDDSTQLYKTESTRSTHRVRGHPTLVSLLESSSPNVTVSSASDTTTLKRSLQDSTSLTGFSSDYDRPSKTVKTLPALETVPKNFIAERSAETAGKSITDNAGFGNKELTDSHTNGGIECSGTLKTDFGGGSARGWNGKSRFTSIAHFMQSNTGDVAADDSPVDMELSRYQSLPFPSSSASPDDWWLESCSQMPTLATIARRVLAVPVAIVRQDPSSNSRWLSRLSHGHDDHQQWSGHDSRAGTLRCPNEKDVESLNNLMFLAADW